MKWILELFKPRLIKQTSGTVGFDLRSLNTEERSELLESARESPQKALRLLETKHSAVFENRFDDPTER